MIKTMDLEGISNIRTLPEATAAAEHLMTYPVTKNILAPLLKAYVNEPGDHTQIVESSDKEGKTNISDAAFISLASMSSAHTLLTQLRNHVRKNLPELGSSSGVSNESVVALIEKGLRATRKNLIDTSGDCYCNLLESSNAEREYLHREVSGYLSQHFQSVDVDGSVDHLLNNRNHTRYTTQYQINFPEEKYSKHVYDRAFLVMTYVPEMESAWLNLLPTYKHAGSFHPGDRLNLKSIGASVIHQLSRYDLV